MIQNSSNLTGPNLLHGSHRDSTKAFLDNRFPFDLFTILGFPVAFCMPPFLHLDV
jgi:hypothetical protein